MIRHPLRSLLPLASMALLLGSASAQAQLNFTLQDPIPTVAPGHLYNFTATLANTSTTSSMTLDGSSFTLDSGGTLIDHFLNTPSSLGPSGGTSPSAWTGDLFDVQVNSSVPVGSVLTGSYDVFYTLAGGSQKMATQTFSIDVAPVPEFGSVVGFGVLTGGLILLNWRQQQRKRRSEATQPVGSNG